MILAPRAFLFSFCILALTVSPLVRADDLPVGAGPEVVLFDGKTLNGWTPQGGEAIFTVEDGAIVGTFITGKKNTFLTTNKEYGDFVLDLDFKIDGENSGIQFRSHTRDDPEGGKRVYGYQAEIDPVVPAETGGVYEEAARGWLNDIGKTPAGAKAAEVFKPGEWNHYRIQAVGDHLQTWVNGTPLSDFHDGLTKTGFIGLQVHRVAQNADKKVRFKNITIREITPP